MQNYENEDKTRHVKPSKEESGLDCLFSHLAAEQEIDAVDVLEAKWGEDGYDEDYYKKMIDENPNDPLVLKRFAQFLVQVRY